MASESEDMEVIGAGISSFFNGLSKNTKLSQKESLLRNTIREHSNLETKATTLSHKIENLSRRKNYQVDPEKAEMFKEKIIVEQNSQPKKKKGNAANILILSEGHKTKQFDDLKLDRVILKAVGELGYVKPTAIQQLAVPVIRSGKDVVASSITGSGKTAAFLMPIIQRFYNVAAVGYIRAMVVTPTRELAIQIF